jgi:putative uncharacterized protein (fragment)
MHFVTKHLSPLRYPGGKRRIYPFIAKLIRENDLVGFGYAEPYAGGAGLALQLLMDRYVDMICINDLDRSIYSFWYSVLNYPEEFCRWIDKVEISIDNWRYFRELQKSKNSVDFLELGQSTFFLNRTNVSGIIKGGPIGGLLQSGKYKLDARFNRKDLISRILSIAKESSKIHLSNEDGIDFIDRIDKVPDDYLVYLDPPYYKKASSLYMNYFQDAHHIKLRERVESLTKKWLVSYDNTDFILQLYSSYRKIRYSLSQCTSNRVGDEVIILGNGLNVSDPILLLKNAKCIPILE